MVLLALAVMIRMKSHPFAVASLPMAPNARNGKVLTISRTNKKRLFLFSSLLPFIKATSRDDAPVVFEWASK